ncbi:MAG: hypothetical protein MJK04_03445 [Psychrosphaera sp.]|nr:hypothetical protein [Psychrosphaera sp.]
MQDQSLNLQYLKESVTHLDELMNKQRHSITYVQMLREALSDIDLEVAVLRNSVEHPR